MTRNSTSDWGWPAKILHWVGAVMILLLLVHGWWMTHMTPRPERLANYAGHSAMGYDLFALLILRLLWRWFNPPPELAADRHHGGPNGAAVARGIASHAGLCACRYRAHSHTCRAASPHAQTQQRAPTHDLEFGVRLIARGCCRSCRARARAA